MSDNLIGQIEEEKLVMELFRQEYDDFPKGKLVKSESPDFILKASPKHRIGIEVTKLHGPKIKKPKTHFAISQEGYQPPEFSKENIDFTIRAKDDKLYLYRQKKLNQFWLLITADLTENPAAFNIPNKLGNWNFNSGFQKVFLFELI